MVQPETKKILTAIDRVELIKEFLIANPGSTLNQIVSNLDPFLEHLGYANTSAMVAAILKDNVAEFQPETPPVIYYARKRRFTQI